MWILRLSGSLVVTVWILILLMLMLLAASQRPWNIVSVVAAFYRHTLLTGLCRGGCPEGSRGPIRLLSKGCLPWVSGPHPTLEWPSGELAPTVGRLFV